MRTFDEELAVLEEGRLRQLANAATLAATLTAATPTTTAKSASPSKPMKNPIVKTVKGVDIRPDRNYLYKKTGDKSKREKVCTANTCSYKESIRARMNALLETKDDTWGNNPPGSRTTEPEQDPVCQKQSVTKERLTRLLKWVKAGGCGSAPSSGKPSMTDTEKGRPTRKRGEF